MTILITGASGFVGQTLLCQLRAKGIACKEAVRNADNGHSIAIGSIDETTDWHAALEGIDVVVHLAARTHIMSDEAVDPLKEYRAVNTQGTLKLARQAATKGVKRFVFVSSVKVNGETTTSRQPFTEHLLPAPCDPYGISKKEAEDGLRIIASETGMEVVIIRPPLVYGPGVKANFLGLLKLADTGLPLPFASIQNKRSMIYVENLVDFIFECISHLAAANQTFLVSDGQDVSLSELIHTMRLFFGRPVRLFPVPVFVFRCVAELSRKSSLMDKLVGDLQVDSSKARNLLNWNAPFPLDQSIEKTVAAYKKGKGCTPLKRETKGSRILN